MVPGLVVIHQRVVSKYKNIETLLKKNTELVESWSLNTIVTLGINFPKQNWISIMLKCMANHIKLVSPFSYNTSWTLIKTILISVLLKIPKIINIKFTNLPNMLLLPQ